VTVTWCLCGALESGLHPWSPRNAATSQTCRSVAAESCHFTAGADVMSDSQSGGCQGNASSYQAPVFGLDVEFGYFLNEVLMHCCIGPPLHKPGRSGRPSPLRHRPSGCHSRHCLPPSDQVRNPATS